MVTLQSASGAGSTFTVWLPVTAEARREDVVAADGVPSAGERPSFIESSEDEQAEEQPRGRGEHPP